MKAVLVFFFCHGRKDIERQTSNLYKTRKMKIDKTQKSRKDIDK